MQGARMVAKPARKLKKSRKAIETPLFELDVGIYPAQPQKVTVQGVNIFKRVYEIPFENPNYVSKGIKSVELNGAVVQTKEAMIELKDDRKTHFAKVILGSQSHCFAKWITTHFPHSC
jgi:hypothetical protein